MDDLSTKEILFEQKVFTPLEAGQYFIAIQFPQEYVSKQIEIYKKLVQSEENLLQAKYNYIFKKSITLKITFPCTRRRD